MVGPVVKREGVAHLQAVMGLSERRACEIIEARGSAIAHDVRRTRSCGRSCVILPTSASGLAIGAYSFCCARAVRPLGSTAYTGSIGRKVSVCASGGRDDEP